MNNLGLVGVIMIFYKNSLFLILLLSSCMQYYRIVKTEGTGIKGHYDKDSIVYLTEAYENIEKQGGKIYIQIRKTEKNIITIVVFKTVILIPLLSVIIGVSNNLNVLLYSGSQ